MRNFENNIDRQINNGNTGWESLTNANTNIGNSFKERQDERAKMRNERMQESKAAREIMKKKVIAWVAAAVLAINVVGGVAAGGLSTPEIMNTKRAEEVQTFNVESVTLVNGPNIRGNPMIPDREDGSNIIMDFGEEGQVARIPYQGEVYYYCNEYDPNGGWYGFPAKEFAAILYDNNYINKKEAERIVEDYNSGDGSVWVNAGLVDINGEEVAQ
jgi:hypothetical protein